MAFNSEKRIDQIATITESLDSDRLVIIHGSGGSLVTRTITKTDFLKGVTTIINAGSEPTEDDGFSPGQIWFDENYLYLSVTDTVVKRIQLENLVPDIEPDADAPPDEIQE